MSALRVLRSPWTWCWGIAFAVALRLLIDLQPDYDPRGGYSVIQRTILWLPLGIALCAPAILIWLHRASLAASTWPMRVAGGFGLALLGWLVLLFCLVPVFLVPWGSTPYTPRATYAEVILGLNSARTD